MQYLIYLMKIRLVWCLFIAEATSTIDLSTRILAHRYHKHTNKLIQLEKNECAIYQICEALPPALQICEANYGRVGQETANFFMNLRQNPTFTPPPFPFNLHL